VTYGLAPRKRKAARLRVLLKRPPGGAGTSFVVRPGFLPPAFIKGIQFVPPVKSVLFLSSPRGQLSENGPADEVPRHTAKTESKPTSKQTRDPEIRTVSLNTKWRFRMQASYRSDETSKAGDEADDRGIRAQRPANLRMPTIAYSPDGCRNAAFG